MPARVYIGRLSDSAQEHDVKRFFRSYGRVREVVLKNGYGFVEFDNERDAEDAVYDLNGKDLCGDRVKLEHARGTSRRAITSSSRGRPTWVDKYGPPIRTGYRMVVKNLSSKVSWQDLKDHMRKAGEVTYADAHKEHKNEGVVEFASRGDLKNALVKLDGMEISGRKIELVEDKPKSRRRHSDSGSRSRSRSPRSRSRSSRRRRSDRRSRSRSRSDRRSRSRSRSDRRSRSHSRSDRRSRSQSGHKSKSRSQSGRKSQSHGRPERNSHSRSEHMSRSRSRSPRSNVDHKNADVRKSGSHSDGGAGSKSRSRSPARGGTLDEDHSDDE